MIEAGQTALLQQYVTDNYEQFTGRTLERWFQIKMMESGPYTRIGNWWDKRGENELDLIAVNVQPYSPMEQLLSPNETVVIYRRNSCSMTYETVVPCLLYTCDNAVVRQ